MLPKLEQRNALRLLRPARLSHWITVLQDAAHRATTRVAPAILWNG
jgi:hypothetical protein